MIVSVEAIVAAYNAAWASTNAYSFSALLRRGKPNNADTKELDAFVKENTAMPKISILLPAYHEANVLNESVNTLYNSNYPKERFEILILLERDDTNTINAAAHLSLKYPNVRPIIVSSKHYKNKPNALNHGLSLSVGEIIGVIDAEDLVEKDLLLKVAYNIGKRGYDVVQGVLDMNNDTDGWKNMMQRAEYSYWFQHLLPGMEASGMPLPLGGTTNFFKAGILNSVGGWNPKNLTEDFELGIKLYNLNLAEESKQKKMARQEKENNSTYPYINKYTASFYAKHASDYSNRIQNEARDRFNESKRKDAGKIKSIVLIKMIQTITQEESPTSWSAWMKQRTRWQQGKIQTAKEYAINMPKTAKGKANTTMAVITPHIAVLNITGIAIGSYAFATSALSLPIMIFTYFNFASIFAYCIANGISYSSIVKPEEKPHRKLKAAIVAITTPAYWVVQWVADIKALKREYIDRDGTWDKTEHKGRHFKNKA